MVTDGREKTLYEPVKQYLTKLLNNSYSNYHLEITANRTYSEKLKHFITYNIVFSFLKKAMPDLTGFILKEGIDVKLAHNKDIVSFITVEVKPSKISLPDIYQAKLYGDLFRAKYALLMSPVIIGEEIRRLQNDLKILNRYRNWKVYIGQIVFSRSDKMGSKIEDCIWYPETPF